MHAYVCCHVYRWMASHGRKVQSAGAEHTHMADKFTAKGSPVSGKLHAFDMYILRNCNMQSMHMQCANIAHIANAPCTIVICHLVCGWIFVCFFIPKLQFKQQKTTNNILWFFSVKDVMLITFTLCSVFQQHNLQSNVYCACNNDYTYPKRSKLKAISLLHKITFLRECSRD